MQITLADDAVAIAPKQIELLPHVWLQNDARAKEVIKN